MTLGDGDWLVSSRGMMWDCVLDVADDQRVLRGELGSLKMERRVDLCRSCTVDSRIFGENEVEHGKPAHVDGHLQHQSEREKR